MRVVRWLAATLGVLATVPIVLEVACRVGGLWVGDEPVRVADGSTVVLCVGDSFTSGLPGPDNYPAELERLLNERAGRPYRVVNAGVPGFNTNEVRARFARYLAFYRPAVVLHWAGINNGWNHVGEAHPRSFLARLAEDSMLVRFVRATLFYRSARGQRLGGDGVELANADGHGYELHIDFAGGEESVRTEIGEQLPLEQIETTTREDLTAMMTLARDAHVPMYAITYPFCCGFFAPVNAAITGVSSDFGFPWVDAAASVKVVVSAEPGAQLFQSWVHPTPAVYRQVAEDVYRLLVAQGLVHSTP